MQTVGSRCEIDARFEHQNAAKQTERRAGKIQEKRLKPVDLSRFSLSKGYKKDILAVLADRVEPSHETKQLQKTRRTTPVTKLFYGERKLDEGVQIAPFFCFRFAFLTFLIFLSSLSLETVYSQTRINTGFYNKKTPLISNLRVQISMVFLGISAVGFEPSFIR